MIINGLMIYHLDDSPHYKFVGENCPEFEEIQNIVKTYFSFIEGSDSFPKEKILNFTHQTIKNIIVSSLVWLVWTHVDLNVQEPSEIWLASMKCRMELHEFMLNHPDFKSYYQKN